MFTERVALAGIVIACSSAYAAPAPAPAPAPMTAADRAAATAYRKAMAEGRKATAKKDGAAAIAAFDRAIAAKPHDARALAERGFAKLVGGDTEGANADFTVAVSATKDKVLLSQIWFNRGLIDEKSDHAKDNARVDFYMANKLRPSAAAASKLGTGGKVCPYEVTHAGPGAFAQFASVDAADWLAFATAQLVNAPTTIAQAKEILFYGEPEPALPAVVTTGSAGQGRTAFLVVRHGNGLRATPLGVDAGGRCPGEASFSIAETVGTLIHVSGEELTEGGMTFMCDDHECKDGETQTGTACFGGLPTERELVIDATTGKVLVVAEHAQLADHDDPMAVLSAKLQGRALRLAGLDCDRVEPF